MSERARVGLLLGVAMLVYGNTLWNAFTLDDGLYIVHNPRVTSGSIRGLFEPTTLNNVIRPVTFATFALNWALGGVQPFGYHLFNLLLHAAVTLMLYLLLRKLLESIPDGSTVAFAAALLFAVHPIHTEAVASIAGRSELLAVAFLLAAWLLHVEDKGILALFCFLLAMMSKESAIVFLLLALAGDYARNKLKPVRQYGLIAALTVLYLGVFWKLKGGRFGQKGVDFLDNPLGSLPVSLRIPNALRIAWKYVGLHIYPGTLSSDYSYNAILLYAKWRSLAPAVVATLCVLGIWIWALWTRKNAWFFAGAIYLVGFAVTANVLIPTGTLMGERLAYLPSAGFCLLVALLWVRFGKYHRPLAWTVLSIIAAALAARTVGRNRDWRDNFTLYSAAVQAVPRSAKAHAGLGTEYLIREQFDAARKEYLLALRIYPNFPEVLHYDGIVESRMGHDEVALQLMEKALSLTGTADANFDYVGVDLAAELTKLGRTDEALKLLNEEIVTSPGNTQAWLNRAVVHHRRGELESARVDVAAALHLDPSNAQALDLLEKLNKSGLTSRQP